MQRNRYADNYSKSCQYTPQECQEILINAPIGIFTSSPGGMFLDANPAMAKMFGYESPQKLIESIEDIDRQLYAEPGDREKIMRLLEEKDEVLDFECPFRRRDGSLFWASTTVRAIRDDRGNIIGIRGISRDISDRRLLEQSLRERETTLQAFFNAAHESMVQIDTKGTIILSNTTGAERLGRNVQELLGTCLYDHFPPEVAKFRKKQYEKVVVTGNPVHFQDTRLGRTFEQHCYPIFDKANTVSGVAIFADEITKRKHAEKVLMERELLFRKLSSQVPGMIYQFIRKPDGTYSLPFTTDAIRDIFGCSPEEVRDDFSVIASSVMREDLDMFVNSIESSAERMTNWRCEYRVKLPGKPVKWLLGQSKPEKQADGSIIWHGYNTDITPLKLNEMALKSSKKNFQKSMGISPLGIRIVSQKGETLYVNNAFCDLFECRGIEEAMALKPSKHYTEKSLREHIIRKERRKAGKSTSGNYKIEIIARDKTVHHLNVWRRSMAWNEKKSYQVIYMDTTGQKIAEENLKDSLLKVRRALAATVKAISVTVEARDPYTAGHQRRVADLARAIATEMGLSEGKVEGIRMAGIIHDVGKISAPSEILSKPTRLTDIEFGLVKAHAQKGYDMLKDIEFSWPVARMVLEHHERIDGSGYPNGLTGKDLLIESKVLAVADVVEAMASDRPYRPAIGIDAALEEIQKNRGILYDVEASDACLTLFNEKGYILRD
ncbi:MAG: PAS domain S-box protein [Deltaproteobacteria bacterium]|nr:PAS domain S-box protein [Deltaproteobacteria bacterium]